MRAVLCPQLLESEPGGPHKLGSATVLNRPTRGSDKQRKRSTEFCLLTRDGCGAVVGDGRAGWSSGVGIGRPGDRWWDRQGLRDVILGNSSQDRKESGPGLGSREFQIAGRILSGVVTWCVLGKQ